MLVWGQDSGAFNLEHSGLRDAESLERLLLVLGVTMLLLVSEGTQVVSSGARRAVDAHWSRGLSYLRGVHGHASKYIVSFNARAGRPNPTLNNTSKQYVTTAKLHNSFLAFMQ